ncbi:MAG: tyrosine-type recombinase/integrase [Acidimicrobiia bacterium]|nr:tyrosine-type recombinase/integrase [Acidimicrobiia bacterium]
MGSVDRIPSGRYRARWWDEGRQRSRSFLRRRDALAHLADIERAKRDGTWVPESSRSVTFGAYSVESLQRQPWRDSARHVGRNAVGPDSRAHRRFSDVPLIELRKADMEAFLAGLRDELAPGTVHLVHQHLHAMLETAHEDGILSRNPAARMRLPALERCQVVPLSRAQVERLLDVAHPWFRVAIILGAGLGLRQAEASGLTRDRIDFGGEVVRVDRQYVSRGSEPGRWAPPKSSSAYRSIPASRWILAELERHLEGVPVGGYVLHRDHEPVGHISFAQAWRFARKAAGLDASVRFHDLRHAFASALISAGCSVRAVQHALGHASASTTLSTYSHLWPGDEDRLRGAIDAAFGQGATE